jgi:hypothetical protein
MESATTDGTQDDSEAQPADLPEKMQALCSVLGIFEVGVLLVVVDRKTIQ